MRIEDNIKAQEGANSEPLHKSRGKSIICAFYPNVIQREYPGGLAAFVLDVKYNRVKEEFRHLYYN